MNTPIIPESRSRASNPPPCFSNPIDNFDIRTPTCWACDYVSECENKRAKELNGLAAEQEDSSRKPTASASDSSKKPTAKGSRKPTASASDSSKKPTAKGSRKPTGKRANKANTTAKLFKRCSGLRDFGYVEREDYIFVGKKTLTPKALKRARRIVHEHRKSLNAWEHTDDKEKAVALALQIENDAHQSNHLLIAVTLLLSPAEQERVTSLRGRKDFHQRLAKYLHNAFPFRQTPYFFTSEYNENLHPHIHGLISVPPGKANLKRLRDALRQAGGEWATSDGKQFQVNLKKASPLPGWIQYCVKFRGKTLRHFNANSPDDKDLKSILMAPNDLRKSAKLLWNSLKASQLPPGSDNDDKPPNQPKTSKPHSAANTDSAKATPPSNIGTESQIPGNKSQPETAEDQSIVTDITESKGEIVLTSPKSEMQNQDIDPKTTGDASNEKPNDSQTTQLRAASRNPERDTNERPAVHRNAGLPDSDRETPGDGDDQSVAGTRREQLLSDDDQNRKAETTGDDEIVAVSFDIADVLDELEALELPDDDDDFLRELDDSSEFTEEEMNAIEAPDQANKLASIS